MSNASSNTKFFSFLVLEEVMWAKVHVLQPGAGAVAVTARLPGACLWAEARTESDPAVLQVFEVTSGDTGERVYCSLAPASEAAIGAAARGARRSGAPLLGRPIGELVDEVGMHDVQTLITCEAILSVCNRVL